MLDAIGNDLLPKQEELAKQVASGDASKKEPLKDITNGIENLLDEILDVVGGKLQTIFPIF